jgi:hypothetical protein
MHNFATGETVSKTQQTKPKMMGFTCVDIERTLPDRNSGGKRLFRDANNTHYYAAEMEDGSHFQP